MRYFMRARRRVRRSKPSHGRSQQMVACPAPACKDSTAASGHLSNAIFSPALMVDCARQQRATTRLPKNAPDGLDQRRRALLWHLPNKACSEHSKPPIGVASSH
eukprot:TRINITY_DN20536_c0_g1_i3.p2 TRINITY_DN20536_c0_g1~~TRINITY_DN20536_c0_g1_i3.p2  ORF type:complete len:104 (+),score=3.37 TRINITY_DN20536_c0_g1_i3:184-495(+)